MAVRRLTSAVCTSVRNWIALQLQPGQIDVRDVSGLETFVAHLEHLVVIGQALAIYGQRGLRLQRLDERVAQIEEQVALQVGLLRFGDRGRLLGALVPQVALVLALVQVARSDKRKHVGKRPVHIGASRPHVALERIELVERGRDIGVRTQMGRHFLCARFLDPDLAGSQGRVRCRELLFHLLPGQYLLRQQATRENPCDRDYSTHVSQPAPHCTSWELNSRMIQSDMPISRVRRTNRTNAPGHFQPSGSRGNGAIYLLAHPAYLLEQALGELPAWTYDEGE